MRQVLALIRKINETITIESKVIIGIVIFTILVISLDRYQLYTNIITEFQKAKKAQHELLINTIAPIISLNISLGLDKSNRDYLDHIAEQNSNVKLLVVTSAQDKIIYSSSSKEMGEHIHYMTNYAKKELFDTVTQERLGQIDIHFDSQEYSKMIRKNIFSTIFMIMLIVTLLSIFIYILKKEFKYLATLSDSVLNYDPSENRLNLAPTTRKDEVGIIHNAILSMSIKIGNYTQLLKEVNISLEEKVKERTQELEEANKKLEHLALNDPLTQLPNRRHLESYTHKSLSFAKRQKSLFSLVMCDIDHFKLVNDNHGHISGDFVLQELAKILKSVVKRDIDFIARYGGEEFVLLFHDTTLEDSVKICKNIQKKLLDYGEFVYEENVIGKITMSFGVTSLVPDSETIEEIIELADIALYKAKEDGRDCIRVNT
ncbi:MAG: diguanylate cyclase [Helicobacteraceae bacterium]|nr:diguanylate cyclase [Helicobacteraceae bacterium]